MVEDMEALDWDDIETLRLIMRKGGDNAVEAARILATMKQHSQVRGPTVVRNRGLPQPNIDVKPWYLSGPFSNLRPAQCAHSYYTVCHSSQPCLDRRCALQKLWDDTNNARFTIQKLGLLAFVNDGFVIDQWGDYQLVDMSHVIRVSEAKYLLMLNPTTGKWHLEGVPRDSFSVRNALHKRKPESLRLIPTAEKGDDWYQQGDVCIWPEDAIMLKPFPTILT